MIQNSQKILEKQHSEFRFNSAVDKCCYYVREFCKLASPVFSTDDHERFFEVRVRDCLGQNNSAVSMNFQSKDAFAETLNQINNRLTQIFNQQVKLENDYIQKIESLKECVRAITESVDVLPLQLSTKLIDILFNYSSVYICTPERNEEVKNSLRTRVADRMSRSPSTKRNML